MTRDDRQTFAEVGQGRLDIPTMVSVAEASGVKWLLVEQDVCERDPFESVVTLSYEYLRRSNPTAIAIELRSNPFRESSLT